MKQIILLEDDGKELERIECEQMVVFARTKDGVKEHLFASDEFLLYVNALMSTLVNKKMEKYLRGTE
jgi:hypothetical protein